jgi:hypothetical protein
MTGTIRIAGKYKFGVKVRGGRGKGKSPVRWVDEHFCPTRKVAKRLARILFGSRGRVSAA